MGLFQKGRVLAQDGVDRHEAAEHGRSKPRNQRRIDFLRSTAMMGKLPFTAIKEGTFAHPTLAESLNNLFMTLD